MKMFLFSIWNNLEFSRDYLLLHSLSNHLVSMLDRLGFWWNLVETLSHQYNEGTKNFRFPGHSLHIILGLEHRRCRAFFRRFPLTWVPQLLYYQIFTKLNKIEGSNLQGLLYFWSSFRKTTIHHDLNIFANSVDVWKDDKSLGDPFWLTSVTHFQSHLRIETLQ